jgi:arsenate reductase
MPLPTSDERCLLLHNPRCSKSRAAKALLEERGVAFEERRYLDEPLARNELSDLAVRLGLPAREWVRTGDEVWQQTGLGADADDAAVLDAVAGHPSLLQRPILVRGKRAAVGRPPERILELLD